GMFFLALIGAPVLRHIEPASQRQALFQAFGLRFRRLGWAALATLVVTGTLLLHVRGLLIWDGVLGAPDFWRTRTGVALAVKLGSVTVMLLTSGLHDFILGPAAGRAVSGSNEALALRQRSARLARFTAMLGLLIVIAAVALVRPG
ncbi:MAG TPA: CopD family protein, partial [Gemmatimonadaceae bacterium]|nr:CopD family protein [Gemmatimonadaceae bacterium]